MPFKTNLNFVNPHTQHNPADFAVDNKLKQQVGNHYSEKFVASPKKKAGFFAGIANFFGRIGKSSQNAGSTKQVRQAKPGQGLPKLSTGKAPLTSQLQHVASKPSTDKPSPQEMQVMGGELRNSRQSERQGGHDYKNGLVRCAISTGSPKLRAFVGNVFKADFVSENISYLTWSSKNLAAIDPNSVDYDSSAKLSASDALDLRDEFIDPKGASQVNLSSRDRRVALKAFDNVFPKLSTARKNYRDAVDAFDKAAPADRDKLAGRIGIARQSLKNAKRDAAKQELAAGQQAELVGALKIVDQSVGKLAHTTIELAFTNAGVTLRDD